MSRGANLAALCILIAIPSILAVPQSLPDPVVLNKLYGVFAGQTPNGTFVIAYPGIPLVVKSGDLPKQRQIALLLDRLPPSGKIYEGGNPGTVQQSYAAFLADLSKSQPKADPAQESRELKARQLLFEPDGTTKSHKYALYLQYKDTYERAQNSATVASKESSVDRQAVISARRDWIELGSKDEVEAALAQLGTSTAATYKAQVDGLKTQYAAQLKTAPAGTFQDIGTFPDEGSWDNPSIWSKLDVEMTQLKGTTYGTSTDLVVKSGLWSFRKNANNVERKTIVNGKLRVSGEITRVALLRPWMSAGAYRQGQLTERSEHLTSEGGLCTDVLLARNVHLTALSRDTTRTLKQHVDAGDLVGWGPFAFSGRLNGEPEGTIVKPLIGSDSISAPFIQIVGWFCQRPQK